MLKITVGFKRTTRDKNLYTTVMNMEEKSNFIKDFIEFYMKYLEKNNEEEEAKC